MTGQPVGQNEGQRQGGRGQQHQLNLCTHQATQNKAGDHQEGQSGVVRTEQATIFLRDRLKPQVVGVVEE